MLGRLIITRLVTVSLTVPIGSSVAFFFSPLSRVAPPTPILSFGMNPTLRRTARRTYHAAVGHEASEHKIPSSFTETPQKRPRKASQQHPRDEGPTPIIAPSTPDLADPQRLTYEKVPEIPSSHSSNDGFVDLNVPPAEFRPSASLTTGQSFHWKPLTPQDNPTSSAWGAHDATDWIGTLRVAASNDSLVVHVRETPETTLYKVLHAPTNLNVDALLRDYFQLHIPLGELYQSWSEACPRLRQIAECIPGVRMLQQDPWETLISFICSANNNIPRITKILAALRQEYGRRIDLKSSNKGTEEPVFTFPSLQELRSKATEADLRRLGWGYRARYVMQTMEILHNLGGERYLTDLREKESDPIVVQEALLQFAGVGRKVADCIALFSLRQTKAIPVDVHVWNIAQRDYCAALANVKSLTPSVYKQVGDIFRSRFGDYAGWAHSLLFVAELPSFRPVLPQSIIQEMDSFRELEQKRKQELKQSKTKA